MSTSMHRLQISLPRPQFRYLADQARREGVSMAEILRRLIRREAERGRCAQSNRTERSSGSGKSANH